MYRNLFDAVEYMHNNKIAHRNLKPENIWIDDEFNLKIADFELATSIQGEGENSA